MPIDQEAIQFIIDEEDSTETYYDRTEEHWDWPEGASGPTVGVGYDCGYVTIEECKQDWTGIVDDRTVTLLSRGVGFKGSSAHYFVQRNHDAVTITWDQAVKEFTEREVPKWEKILDQAVPHTDLLSPLSRGALLSVTYNRGQGGYSSNIPRFREMRLIKGCMESGFWSQIPDLIESMKRLWKVDSDLYKRRIAEAALFEKGVPACRPLLPSSTLTSGSEPSATPQSPSPPEPSTSQT